MTRKYDFDLVIIGGGAAGLIGAKTALGMGKRVAIVEASRPGGDCTWHGCIPSKTIIRVAHMAHVIKHATRWGLSLQGGTLSTQEVLRYVRSVRQRIYQSHTPEALEALGIKVLLARARFLSPQEVELQGQGTLRARYFLLATGSSALVPPLEGLQEVPYLTNANIFELEALPASLLILGGGPIGIELAQAFNRLGVQCTVVEMFERILPREDEEPVALLSRHLQAEGLRLLVRTKAIKAEKTPQGIALLVEGPAGREKLRAQGLLVAVGRVANTEGLGLEAARVEHSPRGIKTDRHLRTTAPNIYAAGDVVGPYQFSHMAEEQALTAVLNMFLPIKRRMSYAQVLWCTFTDPELAHLGLTEQEARERLGRSARVFRYDYQRMDRARTDGAALGLAKYILDAKGRLVGAHILGPSAGETIHEAQLLRALGIPFRKAGPVVHAYPHLHRRPEAPCWTSLC